MVSYFLCKYASQQHNVTYLGLTLDQTGTSLSLPGVKVKEKLCKPGLMGRREMLQHLRDEIEEGGYDVVFTQYFAGLSILKSFFADKNLIVDIRSGYLLNNPIKRKLLNTILVKESKYITSNITINSKSLGRYLGFNNSEIEELPLGAEAFELPKRSFENIKLIYIGTLTKRNIDLTVEGLGLYIRNNPSHNVQSYDIIGSGTLEEEHRILCLIEKYNLGSIVKMHGYIPREKTEAFLKAANVGVSFVPITPYYDLQPVTKSYEFLLAGLPIIATKTSQNQLLIDESNGVLIADTSVDFANGIENLSNVIGGFCGERIQQNALKHSWENVIKKQYLPYIEKVAERNPCKGHSK